MGEARYTRLPTREGEDGLLNRSQPQHSSIRSRRASEGFEDEDLRFRYEIVDRVPWKSVLLAVVLLLSGSVLITISHLIFTSHIGGETSQAFGFLLLGILVFLPGFYETRIAYYSWRGYKGYHFSRIPAY